MGTRYQEFIEMTRIINGIDDLKEKTTTLETTIKNEIETRGKEVVTLKCEYCDKEERGPLEQTYNNLLAHEKICPQNPTLIEQEGPRYEPRDPNPDVVGYEQHEEPQEKQIEPIQQFPGSGGGGKKGKTRKRVRRRKKIK